MTIPVFPTLIGIEWPVIRSPEWNTIKQDSTSGLTPRYPLWSFPRWHYQVSFSLLRQDVAWQEWQQLVGFFNILNGAAGTFAFQDANDNAATAQGFGTGDGATTAFQLIRTLGGFSEPVYYTGVLNVYINGTLTTAYTANTGLITFSSAPASGAALTWTGTFAWLCQFDDDMADFSQFAWYYWQLQKLKFSTVKL